MGKSVSTDLDLIFEVVKKIPRGKVMTYGQIVNQLKIENLKLKITPRMVGRALHNNPDLKHVPCHRVVGFDGRLTGYAGGIEKKRQLLAKEGVQFRDKMHVDLKSCLWQLKS